MGRSETNLPLWLAFLSMKEQATHDWLTGLYNRRYFEETLSDHVESARRYERELSLVLFDLDGFKQINDAEGHETGDAALRRFSGILQSTARKADIICRFGGDEFAVILPETARENALNFVARVSAASDIPVTAGVSALPCENLVAEADAHLLAGKKSLKSG